MTDMQPATRRFTQLTPISAPPGLERFVTAVRRLQDLAVSTRPGPELWTDAAYLHVDYRAITPIDRPLVARGRIESVDGRKAYVSASMTDTEGTVLSEANGLMVQLLPHQP